MAALQGKVEKWKERLVGCSARSSACVYNSGPGFRLLLHFCFRFCVWRVRLLGEPAGVRGEGGGVASVVLETSLGNELFRGKGCLPAGGALLLSAKRAYPLSCLQVPLDGIPAAAARASELARS